MDYFLIKYTSNGTMKRWMLITNFSLSPLKPCNRVENKAQKKLSARIRNEKQIYQK